MLNWFKQQRCEHVWNETYSGAFPDEPGGPRTMHYIHWQCKKCCKVIGDPIDRNSRAPETTNEMKRNGWSWQLWDSEWIMIPQKPERTEDMRQAGIEWVLAKDTWIEVW